MSTSFSTLRSQAVLVALGVVTVDPQGVTLDVDRVLQGNAPRGKMTVKQSPDGHVSVSGERVVAFVDGSGALRWVGRLAAGPSLETGVIRLQGFFDFNAHVVTPGVMSLAQIQTALRTGSLVQTFEATLAFPDGHGGLQPAPARRFTLVYDPFASQLVSLTGLALPCLGNPSLFGLSWGTFELMLSDTCLTNTANQRMRSLTLEGDFTGLDANGAIAVQVAPTRPFVDEPTYDAFARDRDITTVVDVLRLAPASGAAWTWRVEDVLVDPQGKTHAARGVSSNLNGDVYDFEGVSVTVSPGPKWGSPGGNARGMMQLVDSGTLKSCSLAVRGQTPVSCTLSRRPPIYVRR